MSATHDRAGALAADLAALNERGAAKALGELARHLRRLGGQPRPVTAADLLDAVAFSHALGLACEAPPRPLVLEPVDDDAYVAGDYCGTCDQPFELCGHMRPETPDTEADHAENPV